MYEKISKTWQTNENLSFGIILIRTDKFTTPGAYNKHFITIALWMSLHICSCNPNRIYEKNITIEGYKWSMHQPLSYKVNITDTTLIYRISMNVRHARFYLYSNLWIMIHTTFPDGTTKSQRVELPLADKEGRWYGHCIGDICDVNITIQQRAYFNQTGIHHFRVEQIMRDRDQVIETLPGIMAMGLRLDKVEPRKQVAFRADTTSAVLPK